MAKNWAIAIGINNYYHLQRLKYAHQDAERVKTFLELEAGFDRVLRMSEAAKNPSFHRPGEIFGDRSGNWRKKPKWGRGITSGFSLAVMVSQKQDAII